MTSKKSSVNPFRFTFINTIKKVLYIPLILFAEMTVIMAGNGFLSELSNIREMKRTEPYELEDYISSRLYVLSSLSEAIYYFFIHAVSIIAAVLLAILIFKFLTAKNSVNVFMSLGISRKELFFSKYLAGTSTLTAAQLLAFAVNFLGNGFVFGFSVPLAKASVYYFLIVLIPTLFAYGITALVISCVGSLPEGLFYSIVLIITPPELITVISTLFQTFVYGAPYNEPFIIYPLTTDFNYASFAPFGDSRYLDPVFFGVVDSFSGLKAVKLSPDDKFELFDFDFKPLILWLFICAAVAFAAYLAFKRRKSEYAGFLGVNRILTSFSVLMVSLTVYSIVVSEACEDIVYNTVGQNISSAPIEVRLIVSLVGILIIALVYLAFELILFKNGKKIKKDISFLAIESAVFAAIVIIFSGGVFGYSGRIPSAVEVESVMISTGTANTFTAPFKSDVRGIWPFEYGGTDYLETGDMYSSVTVPSDWESSVFDSFKQKENIVKIIGLHKKLIGCKGYRQKDNASRGEQRSPQDIGIIYKLKNGKTVARHFNCEPVLLLSEISELQNTEEFRRTASEYLASPETFGFRFVQAEVMLADSDFTVLEKSEALTEAKEELLKAISRDIAEGTLPLGLVFSSKPLGFIKFSINDSYSYVNDYDGEDEILIAKPDIASAVNEYYLNSRASFSVPVYPEMKNTLDFLKNNGVDNLPAMEHTVQKLRLFEPGESSDIYGDFLPANIEYGAFHGTPESIATIAFKKLGDNKAEYVFEDKAEIEELLKSFSAYGKYIEDAYYAELTLDDGSITVGMIPASAIN